MGCFSGSESKSTQQSYTPAQAEYQKKALELYGPTMGEGQPSFPGERVAPMAGAQTEALSGLGGFLDTFGADRDMPLFGQTGTALQGILSGETGADPITPKQTSDYFERVYQAPAMKGWKEDIRPTLREAYAGPGFWGTSRAKAETKGMEDVQDWLGTKRGGLEWDVLQQNQAIEEAKAQRTAGAVPMGMQYGQQPTQEAGARLAGRGGVFELAGAEQQQRQAEINAAIGQFAEEQRLTDPENMQILLSLLGMSYSYGTESQQGAGLGYGMLSGFAGGLGLGAGSAAGKALIASDIRVKENIKPLENALDKIRKLKAYTYNYIWQDNKNVGLIAQDVEKVLPEAVVEINGIKHVSIYAIQSLIIAAINELIGGNNNA